MLCVSKRRFFFLLRDIGIAASFSPLNWFAAVHSSLSLRCIQAASDLGLLESIFILAGRMPPGLPASLHSWPSGMHGTACKIYVWAEHPRSTPCKMPEMVSASRQPIRVYRRTSWYGHRDGRRFHSARCAFSFKRIRDNYLRNSTECSWISSADGLLMLTTHNLLRALVSVSVFMLRQLHLPAFSFYSSPFSSAYNHSNFSFLVKIAASYAVFIFCNVLSTMV